MPEESTVTPTVRGTDDGSGIAIIGLAGRFPGAPDADTFWRNLSGGVESVTRFTDDELLAAGESPALIADPRYVKASPALKDIDLFDAGFFGWSPRDAAVTDPQHRIFLEIVWQALEHAGYDPSRYGGPIGVFASSGMSAYLMYHLVTNPELVEQIGEWLLRHTGNDMSFLATRASYEFDLRGPAVNVQTACSSSLVAIHMATQSLLLGECDMALVGATTLVFPEDRGYLAREGEILAADGHCRPFDNGATGTIFGGGVGCVLLKRLPEALADGDQVLAVIRGSAINNDGAGKVGFLAPSVGGQARVVSEALAAAGVYPAQVGLIEAHGTGTIIGDPIEVRALTQAFRGSTDKRGYCALGSVKANIGHLGEAAGMAGLIKTVLALKHRQIPPLINFTSPNSEIALSESPFTINTALVPWESTGPRIAGVTALGAGGTNAHVLVEEAPPAPAPSPSPRPTELLLLSAKSDAALDAATVNLADLLAGAEPPHLADAAYTLAVGRKAFPYRRAVVGCSAPDLSAALDDRAPGRVLTHGPVSGAPPVAFMFAGGGAQYAEMGLELYQHQPLFRAIIDQGAAHLRQTTDIDLLACLYPAAADRAKADERLEAPSRALPALFATQYALASVLLSWGIEQDAMIGHSMGEYVAACIAGVLTYEEALSLVAVRGRLFERAPAGGMLSVALGGPDVRRILADGLNRDLSGLSIAAVNAPELCVVSGVNESLTALEQQLTEREIETTRIHIDVPAHSEVLEPILPEFERHCRTIAFKPPQRRYVSNLTGDWITAAEATNPRYWVDHLRHTVQFSAGLATLVAGDASRVLLEVGPGRTLTSLARAQLGAAARAVSTLPHPGDVQPAFGFLQAAVGQLWTHGVEIDWQAYYAEEGRRRVQLPSYAFQRKRHWIPRPKPGTAQPASAGVARVQAIPRGGGPWQLVLREETAERRTLVAEFARERHWLVGEHVIHGGEALIPGTGFLELARAAMGAGPPCESGKAVELRDVVCMVPFVVKAGQPRGLRLTISRLDGEFAIESGGADAETHVIGSAAVVAAPEPEPADINAIRNRCGTAGTARGAYLDQSFMDFGPRWANVVSVRYGQDEALVELALPDAFVGDLADFPLHPALLDMATGGAQPLIPGFRVDRDFFVPFSYGRVLVRRPLTPHLFSHIRYRDAGTPDAAIFDLSVLTADGVELASITDFMMKRGRGAFDTPGAAHPADSALERRPDMADWFYRPSWRSCAMGTRAPITPATAQTLLFCDRAGLGDKLGAELLEQGRPVVSVRAGDAFARLPNGDFVIDARNPADYQQLLQALGEAKRIPSAIVHLWSVDETGDGHDPADLAPAMDLGFYSLLNLAQAISAEDLTDPMNLTVVTTGGLQVTTESVSPHTATMLGPVRVIPREFPDITCRMVDIRIPPAGSFQERHLMRALRMELGAGDGAPAVVAHRGFDRWEQAFDPVRIERATAPGRLRDGGVYLITGGLGGLGLAVAEGLASRYGAKLVLMGRTALPATADRAAWLASHDESDPVSRRIRKVQQLETLGAEVLVAVADVTQLTEVEQVIGEAERRFGTLHGVFHTAGVLDDGVIALKARESAAAVLAPKVEGTLVLDTALRGRTLDCFVLFSSISALCGLAGQIDYAGANAFLDAYAQDRMARDGGFTLSVNWSGWREVGMAADLALRLGVGPGADRGAAHPALANNLLEVTFRNGIMPTEGVEALERLLVGGPLPQAVVSPVNLADSFAQLLSPALPAAPVARAPAKVPGRDLSELDAALAGHEAILEAAALDLEEQSGERRIVAYVVYRPDAECTVSELRRSLRGVVPDGLIPQSFIDLDSLPRLDGGAVDVGALPNPFGTTTEVAAPATPSECLVADLWRELLGIQQVGLHDNFFDVGGHSLLSVRFVSRVHKQLGVRLQHADVVTNTLQQLAAQCDAGASA